MTDIDQQIEEFHRAARRRKAIIFAVSGVLMLALGVVLLVISFVAGGGDEVRGRYPIKVIVGGLAFVLGGISSGYNAYRVGSGQVNDVDSEPPR